ncbi:MAG: hypothetical protein ABWY82_25620, partial [Tardiphaga sp.]
DGTATTGVEGNWSRGDHVHPTDTTRASVDSPVFTGDAKAPTPATNDNDTTIATTAYVNAVIAASPVGAAAPIDGLAYNGMQVNGSIEVSQELAGNSVSASGITKNIVDSWTINTNGSQVLSCSQDGATAAPSGFVSSLRGVVTTANAAPAAGNYCAFVHHIETGRVSRLAWGKASASPITMAFWVRAVRTGTYSGVVTNEDFSRCYPFNFTISLSNTWEYKTITVPGDTGGAWFRINYAGIRISFCLMAGATYTAPANAWVGGTFFGANGTTNAVAATSDAFSITGLVVLPGNVAPQEARSPFIMRPYDQELVTCQRYFQFVSSGSNGIAVNATTAALRCTFLIPMRPTPLATATAALKLDDEISANFTQSSPQVTIDYISANFSSARFYIGNFSGLTASKYYGLAPQSAGGGRIQLDARL